MKGGPDTPDKGFYGVGASYTGQYFGGMVASRAAGGRTHQEGQLQATASHLWAKFPALQGARVHPSSLSYASQRPVGYVIYADPPYKGTKSYLSSEYAFDSGAFWDTMHAWSNAGNDVFVSEAGPPPEHLLRDRCTCVWRAFVRVSMTNRSDAGARRDRTEYLWFRRGGGGDGGDDDDAVWPAPSGTVFHGGCDGDGGVDLDADGVGDVDVEGKVNKDKNEDTAKVSGRSIGGC